MTMDKEAFCGLSGVSVGPECFERLTVFEAEVRRWTAAINLVSRSAQNDLWQRHIVDSAQVFPLCPQNASRWVDLGSGGGFPAIVVACVAAEHLPKLRVTMIESDQRKAAFLSSVSRLLELETSVIGARAEAVPHQAADVVSARAVAPVVDLLPIVERHLVPDGVALLMKGTRHMAEIETAHKKYDFEHDVVPSIGTQGSVTVVCRNIVVSRSGIT